MKARSENRFRPHWLPKGASGTSGERLERTLLDFVDALLWRLGAELRHGETAAGLELSNAVKSLTMRAAIF